MAKPMRSNQNLRVSWKPVNPQESSIMQGVHEESTSLHSGRIRGCWNGLKSFFGRGHVPGHHVLEDHEPGSQRQGWQHEASSRVRNAETHSCSQPSPTPIESSFVPRSGCRNVLVHHALHTIHDPLGFICIAWHPFSL